MSNRNTCRSTAAVAAIAASIALGLAACGGAGSPAAPTAAPDTSSNPTTVLSETLPDVQAGAERVLRMSLPRRGTLAITVEWSDPNNSVTAVLAAAGCFDFHNAAAGCQVRRSIDGPRREKEDEGRQEFIEFPGAEGSYLLTVQNLGPGADSIRVTGVLTSTEATPFPTPPTPRPTERPDPDRPHPRQSGRP